MSLPPSCLPLTREVASPQGLTEGEIGRAMLALSARKAGFAGECRRHAAGSRVFRRPRRFHNPGTPQRFAAGHSSTFHRRKVDVSPQNEFCGAPVSFETALVARNAGSRRPTPHSRRGPEGPLRPQARKPSIVSVDCYRMPVPTRCSQPLSQGLWSCQLPLHRGAKPPEGTKDGSQGAGICRGRPLPPGSKGGCAALQTEKLRQISRSLHLICAGSTKNGTANYYKR